MGHSLPARGPVDLRGSRQERVANELNQIAEELGMSVPNHYHGQIAFWNEERKKVYAHDWD